MINKFISLKFPLFVAFVFSLAWNVQGMEDQEPEEIQGFRGGATQLFTGTLDSLSNVVTYVSEHPKTVAMGVCLMTVTGMYIFNQYNEMVQPTGTAMYVPPMEQQSFTPLQTGEFFIQYPSGLSTNNGLNMLSYLQKNSTLGRQVSEHLIEQGYMGEFRSIYMLNLDRMGTGNWPKNMNSIYYATVNCSRVCVDTLGEVSGFWCKQVLNRVFRENFDKNLAHIIPSGIYVTPGIESEYPLLSYPDLYGKCENFLRERY